MEEEEEEEEDLPTIHTEDVYSEYRHTDVQLYLAYPTGIEEAALGTIPWVLYLHGRDGVNPTPIPTDTLVALERLHRDDEIEPFGFVVVEGGYNAYWVDDSENGRLSSMLHEELPQWMVDRGLAGGEGIPTAVTGISTGGFGAVNYAVDRGLADKPVSALATLAPALPVDWEHMAEKNAFATEQEWRDNDPLRRLAGLDTGVPVGVWIGDEDAYLDGAQELGDNHPNNPVFSVLPGGHDGDVFDAVGEDMVRFLNDYLPARS